MNTVYCTIIDVCLAKDEERIFLVQVNNEFVYKDIVYKFGDVLDIRSQANHKRCSGLVVKKLGDDQEHFLPGYVKGNFTMIDQTLSNKPVPIPMRSKTKPVPQPPSLESLNSKPPLPERRPVSGYVLDVNRNHFPQTKNDTANFTSTNPLFPTQDKVPNRLEIIRHEVDVFLKQIGCYDELKKKKFKYLERACDESQLLEDFGGKEVCARTIFHFLYRGWRPVMHAPQNWKTKLPRSYSVSELYLYMMSKQKRVLGSLLKGLSVDGALMYHILQDDILLWQVLPDQSSVRHSELIELREDFVFK